MDDHIYNQVIYEHLFICNDHPLDGCRYIGQTCKQGMTHEAAYEKRCRDHKNSAAKREIDLYFGYHSLLQQYPEAEYWSSKILETNTLSKSDGQVWMNEREVDLIDKYGGVLKSMTEGGTTLNIKRGGQCGFDARVTYFQKYEAERKRKFNYFLENYIKFKQENSRHPEYRDTMNDINGIEIKIGSMTNTVRHTYAYNSFHDRDMKKALDDQGFSWSIYGDRYNTLLQEALLFKDKYGHCNPNLHYTNKDTGYNLGRIINLVRHANSFNISNDPDKRQFWEDTIGLTFNPADNQWLTFLSNLETHSCTTLGKLPSARTSIGKKLNDIRQRGDFVKHKPERMQILVEYGFRLHVNNTENESRFDEYYSKGTLDKWDIKSKKQVESITKRRKLDPLYSNGKLWK